MNLLCKYIENIHWGITQKTKTIVSSFDYTIYQRKEFDYLPYYNDVRTVIQQFMKEQRNTILAEQLCENDAALSQRLRRVNCNPYIIVNCLVDYFYREKPNSNKDVLWVTYGKYIYKNIIENTGTTTALFPMPCVDGEPYDIEYLGYHYKLPEVKL